MISQELEGMAIGLEELVTHPGNPRRGSIEVIKTSLQRFGQVRPIVVQHDEGMILAGNHTFMAAQELGWDKIACVYVDLPEDEATAYMLMDNRSSDMATWDDRGLLDVLLAMEQKDYLNATGFTIDDIEDLQAALDKVAETETQTFQGDYTETADETAARWADRNEGANREVVMLVPKEDYDAFMRAIEVLKFAYDETSATRTIFRAVVDQAGHYSAQVQAD